MTGLGQLILSRKHHQSVVIGGNTGQPVTVTVVEIRGDKVRLGFVAPPHIDVDRLEIHQLKHPLADLPDSTKGQHDAA